MVVLSGLSADRSSAHYIFLVTGRENVDMAAYAGRGQTLLDTMVERYTTAILDLRAADFLPE